MHVEDACTSVCSLSVTFNVRAIRSSSSLIPWFQLHQCINIRFIRLCDVHILIFVLSRLNHTM